MTETSSFWDGITTGDASAAPYSAEEIAGVFEDVLGSYVIPYSYDDISYAPGQELVVLESSTTGKVDVTPGAALVKGIMYVSDDLEELTVASNAAGNPRIDLVILQRDIAAQTVRLVVSQGTAAATPTKPVVDQTNELVLAWVWVADGYDNATDIIGEEEIHDERVFRYSGPAQPVSLRNNLLTNVEYMAITSSAANNAIAGWKKVGSPSISFNATTFRGRYLQISSATNNEGLETTIPLNMVFEDNVVLTLYGGIFRVTSGEVTVNVYSVNTTTAASTLLTTKIFRPTNAAINYFYIRQPISSGEDAIRITFNTESAASSDAMNLGELSLTIGYLPTHPYRQEVLWLNEAMVDAAWTASAKSTGTTTINLVSSFGSITLPYIHGVILRARCRDSGSAAAASTSAQLQFYHATIPAAMPTPSYASAIVSCAGKTNDTWEEDVVVVPIDHTDANAPFRVYVAATGAGTLDATIEVLGIIT